VGVGDSLASYIAAQVVGTRIKRPLFGKPFLSGSDYIVAFQIAYDTGVALGWLFRDNPTVLVTLFSQPGRESDLQEHLRQVGHSQINGDDHQPTSLYEVSSLKELERLFPEFPSGMPRLAKMKAPLNDCLYNLQFAVVRGLALGITLPEVAHRLWEQSHGDVNREQWDQWREDGLNLPAAPPEKLPIQSHAGNVVPLVLEFVHNFRPQHESELSSVLESLLSRNR
jgi:hypothetical protein